MKSKCSIKLIVLGILLIMPSTIFSRVRTDSLVLARMFSYERSIGVSEIDTSFNVYLKYRFHTVKKNPTLFFVPTMYVLARGKRDYIGEMYAKANILSRYNYDITQKVYSNTFPDKGRNIPTLLGYLTPNLYGVSLLKDHLLSPFNRNNRIYYRYHIGILDNGIALLTYRPKLRNTQLIRGYAYIDIITGRIISAVIDGEYDMVRFYINVIQFEKGNKSLYPKSCKISSQFKFLKNRIQAFYDAHYDCDSVLDDSVKNLNNRDLISKFRIDTLTSSEKKIYEEFDSIQQVSDTSKHKKNIEKNSYNTWDAIGSHLVNSLYANIGQASFKFSPLLNPLYMGYSKTKGLSYRLDLNANYDISAKLGISLNARIGYNFKIHQFYFSAPLRFDYNKKRNGFVEITFGNGNRINNSSVIDKMKADNDTTYDFTKMNLEYFNDTHLKLINKIDIFRGISLTAGCIYYRRTAVDKESFKVAHRPAVFRSFAPLIELSLKPWNIGPVLTCNYERGIKGVFNSEIHYERWEFDAVYKMTFMRLRSLSLRGGGGFYTSNNNDYFVDYSNFRENNLPEGWNDDWTGQFQLLDNHWYNASEYYVRTNLTYESPLMFLTWLPLLGHYIEMERIYASTLWVDHLHPYTELGYGFTNRFFSMGIFVSALNEKYQSIGCKFTFELFSHW